MTPKPSRAEAESVLPSQPNVWSDDLGGYRQRWMAGAFGDRQSIDDVFGFTILKDVWEQVDGIDGQWRTITKARVVHTMDEAARLFGWL